MKRSLQLLAGACLLFLLSSVSLAQSYWSMGSTKSEVRQVQGSPSDVRKYDALGEEIWSYGLSSVTFSTRNGRVVEWSNSGRTLRVRMDPGRQTTEAVYFTEGSHQDEVLRLQGTPTRINRYPALGHDVWNYGLSSVDISTRDRRVLQWNNTSRNLRAQLKAGRHVTETSHFTRGSHKDDVLRLQGTPSSIRRYEALGHEVWSYGLSTVEISLRNDAVLQWNNVSSNLKVDTKPGRHVSTDSVFSRGSHKDDVLRLQGTPTSIRRYQALDQEVWSYGLSTVTISIRTERVIEWNDSSNRLKSAIRPSTPQASASEVVVGVSKDDLIHLMGSPKGIRRYPALGEEVWTYPRGHVTLALATKQVVEYSWNRRSGIGTRQVRYHRNVGDGVTLFYDENATYTGMFSVDDAELGTVYGLSRDGITYYYDEALQPLELKSYVSDDSRLKFVDVGNRSLDRVRSRLSNRMSSISVSGDVNASGTSTRLGNLTFHDLMTDRGEYIHGSSIDIGSHSFDDAYSSAGTSLSGSRMRIGQFEFGDWSTSDGTSISGSSHDIGNFTFHNYTTSDGRMISGTTQRIGSFEFSDLSGW